MPFHPDEATQIYMSSDFEQFFSEPTSLFYSTSPINAQKQTYRLLDSPLTKYFIGCFRSVLNIDGLEQDWNWAKTWSENTNAIPSTTLMTVSRLAVTYLFPFTVLVFYLLAKKVFDKPTAMLSSLFLMTNSIVLLHTRRAMAESLLLFFLVLSLWILFKSKPKYLFLSAIPISLAINTKQSLLFLIPAGLIILWSQRSKTKFKIVQSAYYLAIIVFLTFLLNPIIWKNPIQVIPTMLSERSALLNEQVTAIQSVSPDFILDSPSERVVGFLAQTYITPPAYQDLANYQIELAGSIKTYDRIFLNKGIFRNLTFGVIAFLITLVSTLQLTASKNKNKVIFSSIFLLALLEILYVFPIPFQRYYLPLYPFIMILNANFITFGAKKVIQRLQQSNIAASDWLH